ncbi:MAG: hypothetical protein AB8B53_12050 [Flavobacteriales bacterium]
MFNQMVETWTESAGEIIIMLIIAFILGFLVKTFSGKEKETIEDLESQLDVQNAKINGLKHSINRAEHKNELLQEENTELRQSLHENRLTPTDPE